jgi:hypothetical protein
MKAVEFREQNKIYAKDQAEYKKLPVHYKVNGECISCWELTDEEIDIIRETKRVYVSQLTFNAPLQPLSLWAQNPCYMIMPLTQSPLESVGALRAGMACIINAPSPLAVPDYDMLIRQHGLTQAHSIIDQWLMRMNWKRKRVYEEPVNEYLYMAYGLTQVEKEKVNNSLIYSQGRVVHDTSLDSIGLMDIQFYEVFSPRLAVDSELN